VGQYQYIKKNNDKINYQFFEKKFDKKKFCSKSSETSKKSILRECPLSKFEGGDLGIGVEDSRPNILDSMICVIFGKIPA